MIEVLNSIIKDLNNIYRAGIVLLIFVLWPLSTAYFYLTNLALFSSIDSIKLTFLGLALVMPLVLINTMVIYFILMPLNMELRKKRPVLSPVSSAFLFSTITTTFIILVGDIVACFQHDTTPLWVISGFEAILVLVGAAIIYKEYD